MGVSWPRASLAWHLGPFIPALWACFPGPGPCPVSLACPPSSPGAHAQLSPAGLCYNVDDRVQPGLTSSQLLTLGSTTAVVTPLGWGAVEQGTGEGLRAMPALDPPGVVAVMCSPRVCSSPALSTGLYPQKLAQSLICKC